jgi:DNA-binding transcriptional MerR regulator/quercetin dioxygenase-like cupin family protein
MAPASGPGSVIASPKGDRAGRGAPARRTPARPALASVGIEEAARLVGVSPSAIRAWERQGLVAPTRTPGGARRYSPVEVERLRTIHAWRTIEGLNAAAIRRLLALDEGPAAAPTTAAASTAAHGSSVANPSVDLVAGALGGDGQFRMPERLRALRAARGLTLREVAERSGLSVSFVSAVERGLSGASVSALRRLLATYDTTLAAMLSSDGDDRDGRLVAAAARHAVEAGAGVRIENLANGFRLLEPQLFVLSPGASSHGPYSHPGEEFMYVLEGTLGVWLDAPGEFYRLAAGDSLTFPSTLEHRFQALGSFETRVVWVNTPPTF